MSMNRNLGRPAADRRRAARLGAGRAMGIPALVLGASYLGFGALIQQTGLSVGHGLFSTATGWALPGQVALVELYAVGAPLLVIALAVALTNARLLPMAVTLLPLIRAKGVPTWQYYAVANLIAVTGWAAAMRDCPGMPEEERLPYFAGFALVIWSVSLLATALGVLLAGRVPEVVTLGLVFINPVYFMLVVAGDVRGRSRTLAAVFGAVAGPLLYLVTPDWSLLLCGVLAGSAAFLIGRWRPGRA